jgi:hypothetical protein
MIQKHDGMIARRGKRRVNVAGVSAAAAGLLLWGLSEIVMAPAAHADDPVADILNDITTSMNAGEGQLATSASYFELGEVAHGLNYELPGLENLFITPEEDTFLNGIDALTGASEVGPIEIGPHLIPVDLAQTATEVDFYYNNADSLFSVAFNDFSAGDVALAALVDTQATNSLVEMSNVAILGLAESIFGS